MYAKYNFAPTSYVKSSLRPLLLGSHTSGAAITRHFILCELHCDHIFVPDNILENRCSLILFGGLEQFECLPAWRAENLPVTKCDPHFCSGLLGYDLQRTLVND